MLSNNSAGNPQGKKIDKTKTVTVIGAGLVGSLLAINLAKRGFKVQVFERRTDPRVQRALGKVGEGRSINLAISARGLSALERVGLKDAALDFAIPMYGRRMHAKNGELTYQAYGEDESQAINSISRGWLNCFLLDEAEKFPNVKIEFGQKVHAVDPLKNALQMIDVAASKERQMFYDMLLSTDGSASAVRNSLQAKNMMQETEDDLSHGYKEFVMEADGPGQFKIDKNALHIWPRGPYMMIALPNADGSYTCTLFLSHKKSATSGFSFEELSSDSVIEHFFKTEFADFCEKVPNFLKQYHENPIGRMVTVKCSPWGKNNIQLLGDAAHAIVPFFGQGMNAGFEDVEVFSDLLDVHSDWQELFTTFFEKRKTNADAIADMAVENFVEMSAKTADERFLYQKKIEKLLHERFPQEYTSRYSMVSFSKTPYRVAYELGKKQNVILEKITEKFFPSVNIDFNFAHTLIKEHLS